MSIQAIRTSGRATAAVSLRDVAAERSAGRTGCDVNRPRCGSGAAKEVSEGEFVASGDVGDDVDEVGVSDVDAAVGDVDTGGVGEDEGQDADEDPTPFDVATEWTAGAGTCPITENHRPGLPPSFRDSLHK